MKPKILFVSDTPDWAIARNVDAIQDMLSWKYEIDKAYFVKKQQVQNERDYKNIRSIDMSNYDLVIMRTILHVDEDVLSSVKEISRGRVVATIAAHHCFDDYRFTEIFKKRSACFDNAFCVSDGIYDSAIRHFSQKRHGVFFTPQGIDTTRFYNLMNGRQKNEVLTIGWAGNASHGKPVDHKRFYKIIVPIIDKLYKKYRFKIAAHGINASTVSRLLDKGIVIERVPFDDMINFYNSIDVFLNASKSEAIASTTCEAIACGTPVITTAVGHAESLISDGHNGYIVEPDVDSFIEAIGKMAEKDKDKIWSLNRFVSNNVLNWKLLVSYTDMAISKILGGVVNE